MEQSLSEPLLGDTNTDVNEENLEEEIEQTVVSSNGNDLIYQPSASDPIPSDTSTQAQQETDPPSSSFLKLKQATVYVLHKPILPEEREDLKVQFRFLKFLILTALGITAVRLVIFSLDWEHREGLTLSDTWLYEGNLILLDCIAFFSVGRLYNQKLPVDHFAWITTALISSFYTSVIANFPIFQHSVTLYELFCEWPWQLWVFVFGLNAPIIATVIILHIRHAKQQGQALQKSIEVMGTALLFLVPQMANPSFEFHHWFAGLLCGMHANYDVAFSRLAMAWCWGQYINGIAVWGRDPTLTCAYAHYISTRQNCHQGEECWEPFFSLSEPDWRHCNNYN